MFSKVNSLTTIGLDAVQIDIEVDMHNGLPCFTIVGLGDAAIQESKERIRSAIKNSDYNFPMKKIVVSLAPSDIRKSGPIFDLPIAIGILLSSMQINHTEEIENSLFVGELALNGDLRHVNGILPMALSTFGLNKKQFFVPYESAKEASFASNIDIIPVRNIREIVDHLTGVKKIQPVDNTNFEALDFVNSSLVDFSSIYGQQNAKRALEISAAGSHNILMNGSPGAGKTLMAKAFKSILPSLTRKESIEVAKIYSISGCMDNKNPITKNRPFRTVHHTASSVSIVGGGSQIKPGEISLAHKGVLFLDELPEFPKQVLEVLRQPLEDKKITISRAKGSVDFPADFILLATMNPCSCGYYGVVNAKKECSCSMSQVQRYQKRISGPLLDRIDLYVDISPVDFDDLSMRKSTDSSSDMLKRVREARKVQNNRFKNYSINTNSMMNTKDIENFCNISDSANKILKNAMDKFCLSARVFHKILKVSRTIADLDYSETIQNNHVAEAISYRSKMQDF